MMGVKMAIDAALYSGSKCYFFDGNRYVRVTRGDTGPGTVDAGYPASIANWGWPGGFGSNGIDAALYSGSKCYFFAGNRYVRVTRGDTGPGTVDAGYPASIANWGWPSGFGSNGIDAALYSRTKCYFFAGNRYVRVTRGDTGPGTVDAGYPANISNWRWPRGFSGSSGVPTVRLHAKILTAPNVSLATAEQRMRDLYSGVGITVQLVSTENLNLPLLNDVDVGQCLLGQTPTAEQNQLFANRNNAGANDVVVYFVRSTVPPLNGCAAFPAGRPGAVVAQGATQWTMAHEVGHVLGLFHVNNSDRLMTGNGTANITNPPPDLASGEVTTMLNSAFSQDL
jgi:Hemopexin